MTLLEIEIEIDRNTTKKFTVSINDEQTKGGNNVTVFLPQTEDEQKRKIAKDYAGRGRVFWTDGKIYTARECPFYEPK
jgi:hypothetical protein